MSNLLYLQEFEGPSRTWENLYCQEVPLGVSNFIKFTENTLDSKLMSLCFDVLSLPRSTVLCSNPWGLICSSFSLSKISVLHLANINLNYSPLSTTGIMANYPLSEDKLRKCLCLWHPSCALTLVSPLVSCLKWVTSGQSTTCSSLFSLSSSSVHF